MSSLSSTLSIALSGLQTSTAQLQVASNNIANASNPNYTKKTASVTPAFLGGDVAGVEIASYSRATSAALSASLNGATSDASYYSTQNSYLQQVQTLLGSSSSNPALSNAISQFQSAWTQFQAAPESTAQQQSVIQAGSNLAAQIQSIATGIAALARQGRSDINSTVNALNSNLAQIDRINQQITTAGPTSSSIGNLEDQRDQLVNQISSITNITVLPRTNNQIAIYLPSGVSLLDGAAQPFTFNGTDVISPSGQIVTNSFTGGSLQAQLQFVAPASAGNVSTNPGNQVLSKLTSQMSMLVYELTNTGAGSFEGAYNAAATGTGELASGFFSATSNDPNTFAINANLLNGTNSVKQASAASVVTALATPITYPPGSQPTLGYGLPANSSGTISDIGNAILSYFQQAASTVTTSSQSATQQQTYYQQALSNATGVNVDSELVNLTTLQNSYAASAHVITTVNQMFTDLINILQ